MKTGFALIEVIIAAAIASMLSAVLFLSWSQIQRTVVRADNRLSVFDRMMLVHKQFEHDFSGICVPVSRPYLKPEDKEEEKKPGPQAQTELPVADAKDGKKKEKTRPIERLFYAQKQGDMFESLTCITNNPLQVYWSEKAGSARPRIARIQYRLEQDPKTEKKPSYTLYRQEAYTLDLEPFKKGNDKGARSYELISGIKELKITYWQEWQVQKEAKESDTMNIGDKANVKEGDKKNDEPVKEIKKITTWDLDKEPVSKDTFIRPIPTMIVVELTLWDLEKKKTRSFNFMIPIPVVFENPKKKKKESSAAPAAPTQPVLPGLPALPFKMGPQQTITTSTGPRPKSIIPNLNVMPVPQDLVITPSNQATLLKDLLKDEKGMNGKHA